MATDRPQWFADVVRAGLDTKILTEADVLAHATPAVLVAEMPPDVVVGLLAAALDSGTISPASVLQTITPELLAEHVAHRLLWVCIAAAADRAGIPTADATGAATDGGAPCEFLRRVLQRGIDHGVITPALLVRHVTASVLGHHFPDALKTKLLEVTLAAGKMNPEIIVDTLGIDAMARHPPMKVVWACIAEAGDGPGGGRMVVSGELGERPALAAKPAAPPSAPAPAPARLELIEDDDGLDGLQVDLDEVAASIEQEAAAPALLDDDKPAKKGFFGRAKRG